jgi:plasmid stability protein
VGSVATLYVRDLPERLYERLRSRARRNGRSVNAEVIHVLQDVIERERDAELITRKLAQHAKEINLPSDAPKPEDIIREERDSR